MNEELDVAALESISVAENYNNYITDLFFSNIDKDENILDFGAGYGLITEKIKKKGYKISAVEINEMALQKLKDKNIDSYNSIEKVPKSVNCIISLNVLEHIEDDDEYIKKFYKHLPADGKLILYLPSSELIWTKLDEMVNHKRRYSKSGIIKLLKSNNFEIEKIFFVDFIGWIVLFFLKMFRVKLDFDKRKIKFYDKFIFRTFKFTDYFFKNIIGKNLFIVASNKK